MKEKGKIKKPLFTGINYNRQYSLSIPFPWTCDTPCQRDRAAKSFCSLLFGRGRKWQMSPVVAWILASRMTPKSDKVGTKSCLVKFVQWPLSAICCTVLERNSCTGAWRCPVQEAVFYRIERERWSWSKPQLPWGSQFSQSCRYSDNLRCILAS